MTLHLVGTRAPATVRLCPSRHFDAFWKLRCNHPETGLACRKGEQPHPIADCESCPRFIAHSTDAQGRAHIDCHWSELDPVGARMTLATALAAVDPDATVAQAEEVAECAGVRHLLVMDTMHVLGLVCRCDLFGAPRDQPIRELATREIFAISPRATIGEAATAMSALGIGLLPVVADELLVGVISRGDLRRAGVPEAFLGAHSCRACGSPHGVRSDPRSPTVELCLDCLERAYDPPDETGQGD